jgi:hypothetical protein
MDVTYDDSGVCLFSGIRIPAYSNDIRMASGYKCNDISINLF